MPFVLLLVFALICLQARWPDPPFFLTPTDSVLALLAVVVLLAWLGAEVVVVVLRQRGPVAPRRAARWRRWHFSGVLAAYLVAVYFLGAGKALADFCSHGESAKHLDVPGFEVLLFLPLLLALILSWERFYALDRRGAHESSDHALGKAAFLTLQIRHNLLIVMPPMILLLLHQSLLSVLPELDDADAMTPALGFGMMLASFLGIPLLLRLFLGLKPLPPGPLRHRLEATADRLGFRCSNVLVWNTRHSVANAMVTGFVPWVRYIVLTDRLIDELTPDEIEAVFGHEVGHVKHHHMLTYVVFCLITLLLVAGLTAFLQDRLHAAGVQDALHHAFGDHAWTGMMELALNVVAVLLMAAYIFFIFGYLSRRCERQADLFGCQTVSSEAFINALEKVAHINGIPRDRSDNWFQSWQHPTIGQRIDFLRRVHGDPRLEPHFHASLRRLKWGLVGTLGLTTFVLFWLLDSDQIMKNVLRWM